MGVRAAAVTTPRYRSRFGSRGKFNAEPTLYRGERYDSKGEAERAMALDFLLAAGQIDSWRRGRTWVLAPGCVKPDGKRDRAITYTPDFETMKDGVLECEDFKGRETPLFRLKLRLWWRVYPTTPLYIVRADGTRSRV